MSSLTETAYYARKVVNYGIIGIVAVVFLKIGISGLISYWKKIHPAPPAPPNVKFGKLPLLQFNENESTASALTYKLETVTGGFPAMPDQAKVYFMPQIQANFIGFDSAKEQAAKMGFTAEPAKIDNQNYQWVDDKYPARKLTMNIVNGNFNIIYDFRLDPSVLSENELPSKDQAIFDAKGLLSNFGIFKSDFDSGKTEISFLKYDNQLSEVNSLIEANFIKVSFLKKEIDKMPIFYSNVKKAPVVIILSGSNEMSKKLINLDFNYQLVDYQNFATYPVISVSEAFNRLKAGNGYIASYNGSQNLVTVRDVTLGYFDSEQPQTYFQPIYVFTGDENFMAYIPAVPEDWAVAK